MDLPEFRLLLGKARQRARARFGCPSRDIMRVTSCADTSPVGGRDHDPAPDFPVPVDPLDVVTTASGLAAAPADLVRTDELIDRLALIRPACSIGNVGAERSTSGQRSPGPMDAVMAALRATWAKAPDRLPGQVSPPDAAAAATLLEHRASPEQLPRGYRQLPARRSPLRRRPAATTTGPPKPL